MTPSPVVVGRLFGTMKTKPRMDDGHSAKVASCGLGGAEETLARDNGSLVGGLLILPPASTDKSRRLEDDIVLARDLV